MRASLRVISPGLLTTIQDRGRSGYQHLGVPVSGALDCVALAAANALVGNAPDEAALEIFYRGPVLVADAETVRVAVACSEAQIEKLSDLAAHNGQRVDSMQSIALKRGEAIRIGAITGSACAYLAVEGGLAIKPNLGSHATDIRSRIGGFEARALREGDVLPLCREASSDTQERRIASCDLAAPARVRIVPGPQRDFFTDAEFEAFTQATYTVGANSNRMGLRLSGRPVAHGRGANIVSDAVAPGSIQIPGDGQPIVLLADRQTTGGYPKIANVISADIPALGRLRSGAPLGFTVVTLEEAVEARRRMTAEIEGLSARTIPVRAALFDLMPRLMESNLISGVFDAAA
jgi:biotin-dependent carboxylase-like uncharacterized protein